jgi:hypothetical protein
MKYNNKFKSCNLTAICNHGKALNPLAKLISSNPLNSACGCTQMAVTIDVVTENMSMSRRWKAEQVAY